MKCFFCLDGKEQSKKLQLTVIEYFRTQTFWGYIIIQLSVWEIHVTISPKNEH